MGIPNSWLVYFMENPIKMDDLGVPPHFRKPPFCATMRTTYIISFNPPAMFPNAGEVA